MERPRGMFDREWEWDALSRFAADERAGATLGVVSGRRRQGKSFLLQCLCEAAGGFYYEAVEAAEAEALRHLGAQLARHLAAPGRFVFDGWAEALRVLLELGVDRERPTVVVLDELPYLIRSTPELPSLLQATLAPRDELRVRSRVRLVLCGSALSVMGRLLAGEAPLRGRAGLELFVQPFDFRDAARFWGAEDRPELALRLHAIVGGTPAYRREFVRDDAPRALAELDDWVVRTVLDPSTPLFREGRYLLAVEPDLRDLALYHSTLAAIAEGRTARGEIAAMLGRASSDVAHPLTVLEDAGFIVKRADVFRPRRPTYAIAEPIIRFYHAIIRPVYAQLERPGRAAEVWSRAKPTFESQILGPHFEELCREWTLRFAAPETLGGELSDVGSGVVYDPKGRSRHQVDVVARGDGGTILMIGEAKCARRMNVSDLRRLQSIRITLEESGFPIDARARLACFGGAGFTADLCDAGRRGEAVLVDLERLYGGS